MSFNQLERRFGWLSFPGLLRYYAMLHVLVFVLQMFRPDMSALLDFDRGKILSGEVWRMFTCFFAVSQFGGPSVINMVLLFCAVNFAFMINDGLEGEWGVFKTSLFCYLGMLTILLANFVWPSNLPSSGFALYGSAFLAFATLFPKVEILLMLIIPVRIGLLGIVQAALMGVMAISSPGLIPFFLLTFINYIFWVGIPTLKGTARVVDSAKRRKRFNAAKTPAEDAFHSCEICGKTDASHPTIEFRVGPDGREYCEDHLPE